MIAWIVAGALGLIGVYYFFAGLGGIGKGRFGSGFFSTLFGGVVALGGAAAALLAFDMSAYARLTSERPVATINIQQSGPQEFVAQISYPDGTSTTHTMFGDQWRMEAIVVKWKPWTNILGQDAMYKLDRFSGRYIDPRAEMEGRRSVHDLRNAPSDYPQIEQYAERVGNLFYAVDATYGSGVYLPMVDGARYEVTLTQDALIARPANEIAQRAAPGMLNN